MADVLVIDNYDSFTWNLVQYLGELGAIVDVRRNDAVTIETIRALRPEAIVVSPGPCTPREAGISVELMRVLAPSSAQELQQMLHDAMQADYEYLAAQLWSRRTAVKTNEFPAGPDFAPSFPSKLSYDHATGELAARGALQFDDLRDLLAVTDHLVIRRALLGLHRLPYALGFRRAGQAGIPVIVVGNVVVGGTGGDISGDIDTIATNTLRT